MGVYNEKHRAYTDKYIADKYDSTLIRLPKGRLQEVKDYAKQQGKSFNAFINDLINEAMPEQEKLHK